MNAISFCLSRVHHANVAGSIGVEPLHFPIYGQCTCLRNASAVYHVATLFRSYLCHARHFTSLTNTLCCPHLVCFANITDNSVKPRCCCIEICCLGMVIPSMLSSASVSYTLYPSSSISRGPCLFMLFHPSIELGLFTHCTSPVDYQHMAKGKKDACTIA